MLSQDLAMKAAIVADLKGKSANSNCDRSELLAFGAAWAETPYVDKEKLRMAIDL